VLSPAGRGIGGGTGESLNKPARPAQKFQNPNSKQMKSNKQSGKAKIDRYRFEISAFA
jgi:hypothetical protein